MRELKSKKWLLIIAGYAAALGGALCLAAVWYAGLPAGMLQQSGGMAAFGQVMMFVAAAALLGLAPTYFLLRELAGKTRLWQILATGGATVALTAIAAEVMVVAAFLGGGYAYVYADPAFFNLSWLAWLHYKAPLAWRFMLAPVPLAGLLCFYLAAPRGGARRVLGWAALAELSAALLGACRVFLLMRDHFLHP